MSIVNSLLHPHEVLQEFESLTSDSDVVATETQQPKDWEQPDTSILFRRYMEAGRMINVYDWYESFAQVLDAQRREVAKAKQGAGRGRRGKGKKKADLKPKDVALEDMTEEEQEEWQAEVHARFIRALHELDFMGFVKHTGRKADHVMRTIYDIPD